MTPAPPETPLRLLVVSHLYPDALRPTRGVFVHEQVRALRRFAGVDARVLVPSPVSLRPNSDRLPAAPPWEDFDGVPVARLPFLSIWRLFPLLGFFCARAARNRADVLRRDFAFDCIHAHTAYFGGSAARALARRCGKPFILTEHTGPFTSLTRHPLTRMQTRRAVRDAARVLAVSSALAREIEPLLQPAERGKIEVVPNGVDLELFRLPATWRPDPAAPRLTCIGALTPAKNPLALIEAATALRDALPGLSARFVGAAPDPSYRRRLEAAVRAAGLESQVRFDGPQSREETARILREETDLLVLPSLGETFGCVVLEALACGKPVVATRCGGPEDLVTNERLGRLCAPGDAAALATAIRKTAERLPAFDAEAIRAAAEGFGYAVLARRLLGLYETCR